VLFCFRNYPRCAVAGRHVYVAALQAEQEREAAAVTGGCCLLRDRERCCVHAMQAGEGRPRSNGAVRATAAAPAAAA